MDITRDIAQIADDAVRGRMERDPPRTVDGAFAKLAELLAGQHGPVEIVNGRLLIAVSGVKISLRSADHRGYIALHEDSAPLAEASVTSLPMFESVFASTLDTARRLAALA